MDRCVSEVKVVVGGRAGTSSTSDGRAPVDEVDEIEVDLGRIESVISNHFTDCFRLTS